MKKILVLSLLVLTLVGCAWIGKQKQNIEDCWTDPVCKEEALVRSKSYGDTAGTIAGLSPIPAASGVVKSVVSYGSLVVLLALGGSKLKKKNEPVA